MFKIVSLLVVLSLFTQIHASSLDQFIRLTQSNVNLNGLNELSEMIRENRGDIEERQAAAPPAAATPAATTPAATAPAASTGLSGLVSGLLSAFASTFTPFLGPFQPLADAAGPLLNSAFTGILTNALNGIVGVLKSNDLPISGYDTYLVNIPDQGSYIILARSPSKEKTISPSPAPAPVPVQAPQQFTLSELLTNAIRLSQQRQQGDTKAQSNVNAGPTPPQKKPLFIPLSLINALAGTPNTKNLKSFNDYEIIVD